MTGFAKVSFVNKETGARIDGEFIADTGPTWMVKPANKPVQVLTKADWESVATGGYDGGGFGDIFGGLFKK